VEDDKLNQGLEESHGVPDLTAVVLCEDIEAAAEVCLLDS
jgi:hypothetical protein